MAQIGSLPLTPPFDVDTRKCSFGGFSQISDAPGPVGVASFCSLSGGIVKIGCLYLPGSGGCHSYLAVEFALGGDHGIVDYAPTEAERSICR